MDGLVEPRARVSVKIDDRAIIEQSYRRTCLDHEDHLRWGLVPWFDSDRRIDGVGRSTADDLLERRCELSVEDAEEEEVDGVGQHLQVIRNDDLDIVWFSVDGAEAVERCVNRSERFRDLTDHERHGDRDQHDRHALLNTKTTHLSAINRTDRIASLTGTAEEADR